MNSISSIILLILFSILPLSTNQSSINKRYNEVLDVRYIGNYPTNKYGNWINGLQGVGNDDNFWFFTQKKMIWKMPKGIKFEQSNNLQPQNGILKKQMPKTLAEKGYDHFGDLDVKNGFIFIPVEDEDDSSNRPLIAVFKASNLSFVDYEILPKYNQSGWCSVNNKGVLFTSNNIINRNNPIVKYQISWDALYAGNLELHPLGAYQLENIPSKYNNTLRSYIQGGDFSDDDNYFFILNGRTWLRGLPENPRRGKGIWVFKNRNNNKGQYVRKSKQDGNFKYQFKGNEEPQGLTYWDLGDQEKGGGQLHAIMMNCSFLKAPTLFFKHYQIR